MKGYTHAGPWCAGLSTTLLHQPVIKIGVFEVSAARNPVCGT